VILDGENAWETYPYNGHYFFEDLYGLLAAHPAIRTRTFADVTENLAAGAVPPAPTLQKLTAGSWVHGTLSTWIGDPAKNHAWDLLCAAKQSYDRVMTGERLSAEEQAAAAAQLAVCESSDWFWWFGDYNPAAAVSSFDRLFRQNLASLYRCLQLAPPAQLDVPIAAGRADAAGIPASGTMRRAAESAAQAKQAT
jgi:alpha-amylase/alpha-mannosidase (GH57 family)